MPVTYTDYYVDADNGDDANDGSVGAPFATLDAAFAAATPGGTAVGHRIYATGTFDYSASSITVAGRNGSPLLLGGDPVIICDPATTRNLFSTSLGYTLVTGWQFRNVWWTMLNFGNYSLAYECNIRGRIGSASAYSFNSECNVIACTFEGAGTLSKYTEGCVFKTYPGTTGGLGVFLGHNSVCRGNCFFDRLISGSNVYGAVVEHNSLVSSGISLNNGFQTRIAENVFKNCPTAITITNGAGHLERNYSFGHTSLGSIDTPTLGGLPTALTSDPFSASDSYDLSPSGEIAAIKNSKGLNPGAMQASGGGGTAGFTGIRGISRRLGT